MHGLVWRDTSLRDVNLNLPVISHVGPTGFFDGAAQGVAELAVSSRWTSFRGLNYILVVVWEATPDRSF